MKKLTLFLTLSLLSILGISTVVKAEPAEDFNSVKIEAEASDNEFEEAAQSEEEPEVMTGEIEEVDTSEEAAELVETEEPTSAE